MTFSHKSVLLAETVGMLDFSHDGVFADATAGGGGHSALIAEKMSKNSRLICIDKDIEAVNVCKKRFENDDRITVIHSDFENITEIAKDYADNGFDGIIADLGVSSYQLDNADRGFSYMSDAALDMRMDRSGGKTAFDVVNNYSENDLADIFFKYGEEKYSRSIARKICEYRKNKSVNTTFELTDIIKSAMPQKALCEKQHPAKRCFQAIRIEVNGELDSLSKGLEGMLSSLKTGGRMAIITFHSLEDRAVKRFFAEKEQGCTCPKNFPICVCEKKPTVRSLGKSVTPTDEEIKENPRARSARLRGIEKII